MSLTSRLVSTPAWKVFAKYYYPFITRHGADNVVLLNLGYEEDPPTVVPLEASDEPDGTQVPSNDDVVTC